MRTQATQTDPSELCDPSQVDFDCRVICCSTSSYTLSQLHQTQPYQPQDRRTVSHTFLPLANSCCRTGEEVDSLFIAHSHPLDHSICRSLRSSCALLDTCDNVPASSEVSCQRSPSAYSHRHQFVIRKIPTYLNLSPRASYHRLNIKHPPCELTQQPMENNPDSGETILLCTYFNEPLWVEENGPPCGTNQPDRMKLKPPVPVKPKHMLQCSPKANKQIRERTLQYAELLSQQIMEAIEENSRPTVFPKSHSEHGIVDTHSTDNVSRRFVDQCATQTWMNFDQPIVDNGPDILRTIDSYSNAQYCYLPSSVSTQFIEHRSFSENELYIQLKDNCNSSQSKSCQQPCCFRCFSLWSIEMGLA